MGSLVPSFLRVHGGLQEAGRGCACGENIATFTALEGEMRQIQQRLPSRSSLGGKVPSGDLGHLPQEQVVHSKLKPGTILFVYFWRLERART